MQTVVAFLALATVAAIVITALVFVVAMGQGAALASGLLVGLRAINYH